MQTQKLVIAQLSSHWLSTFILAKHWLMMAQWETIFYYTFQIISQIFNLYIQLTSTLNNWKTVLGFHLLLLLWVAFSGSGLSKRNDMTVCYICQVKKLRVVWVNQIFSLIGYKYIPLDPVNFLTNIKVFVTCPHVITVNLIPSVFHLTAGPLLYKLKSLWYPLLEC